jgi:signal transduction histidine kinase
VADTGPGIPEREREHLFERFFRGINAAYTGTGLGLQICKALVDAHGGEMQVESEVGRGSTFTLCLPVGEAEQR